MPLPEKGLNGRMPRGEIERTPRWRSVLAGALDAGVGFVLLRAAPGPPGGRHLKVIQALGPSGVLVRQQLGSPGQRLVGIRTVDERTGARVAAWRSLACMAVTAGAELLAARVRRSETDQQRHARESHHQEIADTYRRHPGDPAAGEAERARLREQAPPEMALRVIDFVGPPLAVSLLAGRLRRRLVRPVEVRA